VDALDAQDWFHAGSHRAVNAMSGFVPSPGDWVFVESYFTLFDLASARVRRNFAKLPEGVVCVADLQFKGRGACD
jgi:hypothetical protein